MSKGYSGKERRKFARIEEEDLLICELYDIHRSGGPDTASTSSFTKNVSEGGVLFESDTIFDLGTVLRLEIDIPGWNAYLKGTDRATASSARHPLTVLGKVVRVEDIGDGFFDIGVAFTAVDSEHREALRKYLEQASRGKVSQG